MRRYFSAPGWRSNLLDFSVNYRTLLVRLAGWVASNTPPPASRYPRFADGTLVDIGHVAFPAIPGVPFPDVIHVAYRADYGPRWFEGIVDRQPPRLGPAFPARVSQVDTLGNEIAGVRNVEIRVPLATYASWNLRIGFAGGENELTDFRGTFVPLPKTAADKARLRDPRPAIAGLYASRNYFLDRTAQAADSLIAAGFLLPEDRDYVITRAGTVWDWVFGRDENKSKH